MCSLGINRLTGSLFLRKWDKQTKQYVTLFNFKLSNYDDVNINSISDDRIELQASDTRIIMYRGHPYVILSHGKEDITINSKFNKVWGERVGDSESEYPTFFDLLNKDNLLPPCIGGTTTISKDCATIFEDYTDDLKPSNITVNVREGFTIQCNSTIHIDVYDTPSTGTLCLLVNGDNVNTMSVTDGSTFNYNIGESGIYTIHVIYTGNDEYEYCISNPIIINAEQPTSQGSSSSGGSSSGGSVPTTGKYKLTMTCPNKFNYRDGAKITYTLTRGGVPVPNKTVEIVNFKTIASIDTSSKGIVTVSNTKTTTVPDTYNIGARVWEGGKLLTSAWKKVKVNRSSSSWEIIHGANGNNRTILAKLVGGNGYNITNRNVTIVLDGKKYKKKTNDKGYVALKVKKGVHSYKFVFSGDTRYGKSEKKYRENVK